MEPPFPVWPGSCHHGRECSGCRIRIEQQRTVLPLQLSMVRARIRCALRQRRELASIVLQRDMREFYARHLLSECARLAREERRLAATLQQYPAAGAGPPFPTDVHLLRFLFLFFPVTAIVSQLSTVCKQWRHASEQAHTGLVLSSEKQWNVASRKRWLGQVVRIRNWSGSSIHEDFMMTNCPQLAHLSTPRLLPVLQSSRLTTLEQTEASGLFVGSPDPHATDVAFTHCSFVINTLPDLGSLRRLERLVCTSRHGKPPNTQPVDMNSVVAVPSSGIYWLQRCVRMAATSLRVLHIRTKALESLASSAFLVPKSLFALVDVDIRIRYSHVRFEADVCPHVTRLVLGCVDSVSPTRFPRLAHLDALDHGFCPGPHAEAEESPVPGKGGEGTTAWTCLRHLACSRPLASRLLRTVAPTVDSVHFRYLSVFSMDLRVDIVTRFPRLTRLHLDVPDALPSSFPGDSPETALVPLVALPTLTHLTVQNEDRLWDEDVLREFLPLPTRGGGGASSHPPFLPPGGWDTLSPLLANLAV